MLRPATPLTILFVAILGLLVVSIVSAPLASSIYLGKAGDTTYGVLGKCVGGRCSSASIGYDVSPPGSNHFTMSDSVRQTLSKCLVLHLVAAAVTFLALVGAGAAHTHAAAHSARYLLVLVLLTFLAFLITVATAIVDIVLFIPHQAFGTYLVIAAAVLLLLNTVMMCSMRRAMVSRKARRRQIAENAEMSGENYYNRGEPLKPLTMSGAARGVDGLPAFASYERTHQKDDHVSDERIPLTQVRTLDRSPPTNVSELSNLPSQPQSVLRDGYAGQPGQRDPYAAPGQGYGANGYSRSPVQGQGYRGAPRSASGGYRGYGAPARGRDGYGRGGMGSRGRGGHYGQPRDGYGGPVVAGAAVAGGAMAGAAMAHGGYDRQPPASNSYDNRVNQPVTDRGEYNNWGSQNHAGYATTEAGLPRAESPPPLHPEASASDGLVQPDEMATNTSNQQGYGTTAPNPADNDVGAAVHMSHGHTEGQSRPAYMSDGSKYSTEEYLPPRAAWNQGSGRQGHRVPSSVYSIQRRSSGPDNRGPTSPLATGPTPQGGYYEDVEPRYETTDTYGGFVTSPLSPTYEDAHAMDGSRSPAGSERSNFTSVSQRGINPRWHPQPPPVPGSGARQAVQQRHDILLDNPDFQLPGGRSGKPAHGNPSGLIPGSAYPNAI
ncbi:hypothetical protein V2A60_010098 [Cordyceps javanica]